MNLSRHISELLVKNNCVIVPNFGGFIANYKSAVIDEVRNKIYPPSKHVLFNPNLLSNDGLLADYVSRQIEKQYSETLSLIAVEVEIWRTKLSKNERISIGEIGFLFKNENGISFEQNREFNLLLDAYGLSTVQFVSSESIPKEKVVEQESNDVKDTKIISFSAVKSAVKVNDNKSEPQIKTLVRSKSKRWKYVAVACLIPALFYSYWIPMNSTVLDTGNIQIADFNPLHQKAPKTYSTRLDKNEIEVSEVVESWETMVKEISPSVQYYNYKFNNELYIPVALHKNLKNNSSEVIHNNEVESVELKMDNVTQNIHLIAGCFSSKTNANSLVKDLKSKGYSAHIVDKNKGLYRVSAESFSTKSEAKLMKTKLTSESISTWILNK